MSNKKVAADVVNDQLGLGDFFRSKLSGGPRVEPVIPCGDDQSLGGDIFQWQFTQFCGCCRD